MSSGSGLPPQEHASFAVISRLLSCLVTEKLLRAFYVSLPSPPAEPSASHQAAVHQQTQQPQHDSIKIRPRSLNQAAGVLVILSTHLISEQTAINRTLRARDIYAIVPLRCPPVFKGPFEYLHGRAVGLVDPLDMQPVVYELLEAQPGDEQSVSNLISPI